MQRNKLIGARNDFFKQSNKKVDCVILSAMTEEQNYLKKIFLSCKSEIVKISNFEFKIYEYNKKRILLSPTGLGTTFTASAVTLIHQHFNPDFILFSGTAGGIKPGVKLRDVIIVEKAFEAEIQGAFTILKGTPFESCLRHPFNNLEILPVYNADAELFSIATSIDYPEASVYKGKTLIKTFNLEPHPEGGFFTSTFKSKNEVKSTDLNRYNNEPRKAGSSIYYLLAGNDFSAWHSLA